MENARDTFYVTLRNRLSGLNPMRTILLRGIRRPGILVEANESVVSHPPADVFVLRWTETTVDCTGPLPLAQQVCEVAYSTEGTTTAGGLDRGRALMLMDGELMSIVRPLSAAKLDYTKTPAAEMTTRLFWQEPVFTAVTTTRDRLSRSAKVTVFSFEEAGER